jgi:ABC-type dipeptide/oligopeptide/nickel transport system permease subunit
MIREGLPFLETAPWLCVFPGVAMLLTVLAFNLLADGLRDAVDVSA